MRRLFELLVAFVAGVYGTLLFFDLGYPPVYPEIHAYRWKVGLIWLAVFFVSIVMHWLDRRELAND